MIIEEIRFCLRDGREALLRSPRKEDAEEMTECLRRYAAETEFVLRYPEECDTYTPEGERNLFEKKNASPDDAMLVCMVDGKLAGNCEISFFSRIKTRHRVRVAIALRKEFWDQGIGTRMFQELIRMAEGREHVTQMELEVIEGNERARHLYEKMGFRIAAVLPNTIRLKDGTLLNEYLMIKEMKREA